MLPLLLTNADQAAYAQNLCEEFGFQLCSQLPDHGFCLALAERLELHWCDEAKITPISVDFSAGRSAHRRQYGGGEAIAKAIGIKKGQRPSVIDATAGLGRDAFVVASLGCEVLMLERHPAVAALLADGLRRAALDPELAPWIGQRLRLQFISSHEAFAGSKLAADVVYLDPMYPHKKKSAQVKKEMRMFQHLVGADVDADDLLAQALSIANKKVIVKRPSYAEPLAQQNASAHIKTKSHRFDVYLANTNQKNN